MTDVPPREVEIRRSPERFVTTTDWLVSRHSFSFGQHYDPDNVGFGPLLVSNEDVLSPGTGFDAHQHSGVDILTWVLDGELTHHDSAGNSGIARPGRVQQLSAGRGIEHSERNEGAEPAHYVQMWVASDEPDAESAYTQRDLEPEIAAGGLVLVAAGIERHPEPPVLRLGNRSATFSVARLSAGQDVELPTAPLVHVFVAQGSVDVDAHGQLDVGDALRCRTATGLRVRAVTSAELLVWELPGPVR
jgi:redox-sensitive bicupin YhaK (pirin superfamily)